VALLFDAAAFWAHPVGPAGRVASVFVLRVAVGALERRPQPALAPLCRQHPLALLPRRTVTDVLTVPALEQRHPVPHLVPLEADNAAPHKISLVAPREPSAWAGSPDPTSSTYR
jgi:hypothetical protein